MPDVLYAYAVLSAAAAPPLPAPARLVALDDLAVLAAPVPRAEYEGPESRTGDPAWVAARAAEHHALVAAAFAAGPLLPLAFGAVFSGEAALRAWLTPRAARLRAALQDAAGAEEWTVTLAEDAAAHAAHLAATDPVLRRLEDALARAPQGTAFLLERQRDRALQAARAGRRATLGDAIAAAR
ncbi:GvpL/GvpF family gas vesicle protein, partial [Paracraurococcus ruber]